MRFAALDTIHPDELIKDLRGMPSTMDKDHHNVRASGRGPEAMDGVDVLKQLTEWVDDPSGTAVFALLGEYGMGKTVTAQRLARQLEARR